MKLRILAVVLGMFAWVNGVEAETPKLRCSAQLATTDGGWFGEQSSLQFEVDLRRLRTGFPFRKYVLPKEIVSSQNKGTSPEIDGLIQFYVAKEEVFGGGSRYDFGILHLRETLDLSYSEAFAGYLSTPKQVFVRMGSSGHGLDGLTLTCRQTR